MTLHKECEQCSVVCWIVYASLTNARWGARRTASSHHLHTHRPCFTRKHPWLITRLFHFLTAHFPYFSLARRHSLRSTLWWTPWTFCRTKSVHRLYEPNDPVGVSSSGLRQCSYHREEQVLGRLVIPARTMPLHLRLRKWMKDRTWACWFHCCTRRREKQVQHHHVFFTLTKKNMYQVHHIFHLVQGRLVAMYSHKRKSSTGVLF